jgi:hypothetical protein
MTEGVSFKSKKTYLSVSRRGFNSSFSGDSKEGMRGMLEGKENGSLHALQGNQSIEETVLRGNYLFPP